MRFVGLIAGAVVLALGSFVSGPGQINSSTSRPVGAAAVAYAEDPPADKVGLAWSAAPARDGEIVYAGTGVRTMPAPPAAKAGVALADLLQNPEVTSFVQGGLAPGVPVAELRLVTTGDFPPGSGPAAVVVESRLSWVLTYHGSPPANRGPAGSSLAANLDCDFVLIFDAALGTPVTQMQLCPPPASPH
jgi:hypothetical protein